MTNLLNTPMGRRQFLTYGTTVVTSAGLALSASAANARTSHKGPWIPSRKFLDYLPQLMELVSLPGLAMAVVEGGKVVWTHAAGMANVETRTPMQVDSVFECASLNKPVFAYVVMKLVDEKRLDLERPLVQYLRPDSLSRHPDIDLITARHVLSHTTGFPNWRSNPEEKLTPAFKPGSRFGYSGEAMHWLQLVVEHITGGGVEIVMRSRLFEPANMPLSTMGWNATIARLAVYGYQGPGDSEGMLGPQYIRDEGNRMLVEASRFDKPISELTDEEVRRVLPKGKSLADVAGTMKTTVTEYARFMALMMERPQRASWEISETSRQAMLTQQVVRKPNALSWGLGWGIEQNPIGRLFYHDGNNYNLFITFAIGDAARRRAIVIFTNGGGGGYVYERIIRAATGQDLFNCMR